MTKEKHNDINPVRGLKLREECVIIAISGPVAQWIEQAFPKRCVGGSIPLRPIIFLYNGYEALDFVARLATGPMWQEGG
jgi:hypothetical protein